MAQFILDGSKNSITKAQYFFKSEAIHVRAEKYHNPVYRIFYDAIIYAKPLT